MDGWNTSFLLGWPIFRGYVSFREGTPYDSFVALCICQSSWRARGYLNHAAAADPTDTNHQKYTTKRLGFASFTQVSIPGTSFIILDGHIHIFSHNCMWVWIQAIGRSLRFFVPFRKKNVYTNIHINVFFFFAMIHEIHWAFALSFC